VSYLLLQITDMSSNSWLRFPVYFGTLIWCTLLQSRKSHFANVCGSKWNKYIRSVVSEKFK